MIKLPLYCNLKKPIFAAIDFLFNPLCFTENLEIIQNLIIKTLTFLEEPREKRKFNFWMVAGILMNPRNTRKSNYYLQ